MSTVHFIGGEKGGVGKSVMARLLCQRLIDASSSFAAFDADRSHDSLLRYYADYTKRLDLGELASIDQLVESASASERSVVVDLPAQSLHLLQRWFESVELFDYAKDTGLRLRFWIVTDGGFDSVSHVENVLQEFDRSLETVVVRNHGRARDFSQLEASAIPRRLMLRDGKFFDLPELDPAIMYKLDRFGSSFWSAIHTDTGPWALSTMERRRAQLWLDRAYERLDRIERFEPDTTSAPEAHASEPVLGPEATAPN